MTLSAIEHFLNTYKDYAAILSILINVLISIVGIIPAWFLTAINIKLFGFTEGFLISFIGELAGTLVSFILYRKGLQKRFISHSTKFKGLNRLLSLEGKEAFYGVLVLRFIPFIPSSLITLFAAFGKITWSNFMLASLIGKLPVILFESYSVNQVLEFTLFGKVILGLLIIVLLIYFYRKRFNVFVKNKV
ncbi:TVP38/TMEM64 family protein [Gottfriedia acidiceleris]|uniref:TVP38/TMEM64 family membrane protein n=1 Tax=Gottfriedia acidiceleris TaxID=371036 RepID=A0ABY4JHQ7_9BACI|nr:VTT domain-containing protein [Gottfriedia acidiceleris]UPM53370.1 VTT domain-containing protein [Gottfriedia acidiceleris]